MAEIYDFTEHKMLREISKLGKGTEKRAVYEVMLHNYLAGKVAIAWVDGEPEFYMLKEDGEPMYAETKRPEDDSPLAS